MQTEFMGTYRGCRKGESLQGTTDFISGTTDFILSGKLGQALQRFKIKMRDKGNRKEFFKSALTGGLLGKPGKRRAGLRTAFHVVPTFALNPAAAAIGAMVKANRAKKRR